MKKYKSLSDRESKLAVAFFQAAHPGVFGVAEAIDEMLNKLHDEGIISRSKTHDPK